jgi:L-ascorbate metabolism protein UlaG (beta-lactamase superfamily)
MIRPLQQDQIFLDDVAAHRPDHEHFRLWWLGQSGFLLQWQGQHLLFDPYLSDSLTRKYALTDKPHIQMTERVVAPEALNFVQLVTSSHNHTDHLDPDTLKPLLAANPRLDLVIPEANREFVSNRLNLILELPIGLDAGASVRLPPFTIHAVPAAHEQLETDEAGRHLYLGYVVQAGPWTIYHSGDTVRYQGMVERLRAWPIDVALLPINGALPERRVAGNLWGREAAQLARDIGARCVIPCHYEMFEFNTVSPAEFVEHCQALRQNFKVLRAGESWNSATIPG